MTKDKKAAKENKKAANDDDKKTIILLGSQDSTEDEFRTIGVFGEIDEEKCAELIYSLLMLHRSREQQTLSDPEDEDSELVTVSLPIELILSTYGGSADEMFAVYDIIRQIGGDCDIITRGLGKVMSAGVLLLACGTKGKREIGEHCRIMIHSVIAGNAGSLHNLENEMEEVRHTQEQFIKALATETKMTTRQIKKMLERKVNVYLTAQEAVEFGIADIII
jgi:ATP-dependent Clp protease protease subunit